MRQIIVGGVVAGALTIFIGGVITIFGIGSKVDGITIRTAKFAVDNLVPIVGKFLSDAVETVVSCSAILKKWNWTNWTDYTVFNMCNSYY